MKHLLLIMLPGVMLLATSCYKCTEKREVSKLTPRYMSDDELKSSIKMENQRAISTVGKIYFKDDYIYISDPGKGIHVIDNKDPRAPQNIGYVTVPGNTELAVKNSTIIANNATDLVSINMEDPRNPVVTGRLNGAFPFEMPTDQSRSKQYVTPDLSKGIVVGWNEKVVVEESPCY